MNKILKSIIFATLLLTGVTTSCNLPVSTPQQETETPALIASPTGTATAINTPTEIVSTATATPAYAPLCATDANSAPAQCQIPSIEEGGAFCTNKKPFSLIFVNKGSTYEALTKGFRCLDNGIKDGRQTVACTGIMASQFEVSVCNPACVVPTVQAKITQCPPDYNYNSFQGCCMQGFIQLQQNCTTIKLKTISCVVDCSVYFKKSMCNKNSVACIWNDASKVCEERK